MLKYICIQRKTIRYSQQTGVDQLPLCQGSKASKTESWPSGCSESPRTDSSYNELPSRSSSLLVGVTTVCTCLPSCALPVHSHPATRIIFLGTSAPSRWGDCLVPGLADLFFSIWTQGLCGNHAPPDHRSGQEASQLDPPLRIYWSSSYRSSTVAALHLPLFNPDVSWDRKNNPELWKKLGPSDQCK